MVGVAGSVRVGGAVMVTDLFVAAEYRGRGVGGRVAAAVVNEASQRCTFSSSDPAALRVYASLGMLPRWQLLTMRGPGAGLGSESLVAEWAHGRLDLVAHFASIGAEVGAHHIALRGPVVQLLRLESDAPHDVLAMLLSSVPMTDQLELSVCEHDELVAWLLARGFEVVDVDTFCATDGVDVSVGVPCVHRGLL